MARKVELRRPLNSFDVTSLVVGSIIGADIYVAAAFGARLVGPASISVWMVAGIIATTIALSFSYCATILPKVGGSYSYVTDVLGKFLGFIVGWALLLAEWLSLAVFPVAFTRYFTSLLPSAVGFEVYLKALFVLIILVTNVVGVRAAGRFNDILTIGKLLPLLLLTVAGIAFMSTDLQTSLSRFQPLFPSNISAAGQALVLIFWAYAGFELSTLPADEISSPEKTIPKAIAMGMAIVILFYMLTNAVIIGVVDQQTLSSSDTPLVTTAQSIFGSSPLLSLLGGTIIGIGALVSILGADESGTIGTSRLAYAMALDGLLPRIFSTLHKSYQTPYLGLLVLCSTAFVASIASTVTELINGSVFLLSLAYLMTCLSAAMLQRKYRTSVSRFRGGMIVPVLGIVSSIVLLSQVSVSQIFISLILLATGIPVYMFFSPKKELVEAKTVFLSQEARLRRAYEMGERFLAHPFRHLKHLVYRLLKKEPAWKTEDH